MKSTIDRNFIDLPRYSVSRKEIGDSDQEIALSNLKIYKNDAYFQFEEENERIKKEIRAQSHIGNFRYIYQVNIQINNQCNYAAIHKECPVHYFKTVEKLDTQVIHKIIDELAEIEYTGLLAFSIYNEAMGDARFYDLCFYLKQKCPHARIFVTTNGSYLNQTAIEKAADVGVDSIFISAYSVREYHRHLQLQTNLALCVYPMNLDKRLSIYDRECLNLRLPCHAPLADLSIDVHGNVILCCLDHKSKYTFGNVTSDSLRDIIHTDQMEEVYKNLVDGKRTLEICKRCDYSRR